MAGFIQFLGLAFFWNLSMDLLLSLKEQCLLKLSKDVIKDEEQVHGEVFIESCRPRFSLGHQVLEG